MKKKEVLESLKNVMASSRNWQMSVVDIIDLVESIDDGDFTMSKDSIDMITEEIVESISSNMFAVVEGYEIDASCSGSTIEVEVTDFEVDRDYLEDLIKKELKDYVANNYASEER